MDEGETFVTASERSAATQRPRRLFERGDLKYVILDLLRAHEKHGYEIIRELEQKFGGFYAPSPGAVYPTLDLLQDMGCVESTRQDGKRVFSLTEHGAAFLEERRARLDAIQERMREWCGPEARNELEAMKREIGRLTQLFEHRSGRQWTDPEALRRMRDILSDARHEIEALLEADEQRR
jgi:DNA-binding PadR family transcriptional regulator